MHFCLKNSGLLISTGLGNLSFMCPQVQKWGGHESEGSSKNSGHRKGQLLSSEIPLIIPILMGHVERSDLVMCDELRKTRIRSVLTETMSEQAKLERVMYYS